MNTNNQITPVIFRKEKDGEILAVFPYLSYRNYTIDCYAHLGQHHTCTWPYVRDCTKKAIPEEYKHLYNELVSIGYQLRILHKPIHRKMYQL